MSVDGLGRTGMEQAENWSRLLDGCDFKLAADEIKQALKLMEQTASEDGHYVYKKEFLAVLYAFLETPNAETAISLLKVAPPLYTYFEGCSPGGTFCVMRRWREENR
jgi:hypothetical protein